jgi:hypothetical protein
LKTRVVRHRLWRRLNSDVEQEIKYTTKDSGGNKLMKETALCLALISSILLFTATLLQAAEQKIIFNTEKIEYKSGTSSKRCQDICSRRSGPDAKSLLSEGWNIVNSSPKEVIGEKYWYTPCNGCEPHGCNCIGTEYILQLDDPAQKVETSKNELDAIDKNKRTGVNAPKVETSKNELDLLKKENELLKQEITLLKQENENLKNQIKSKQRKNSDQPK